MDTSKAISVAVSFLVLAAVSIRAGADVTVDQGSVVQNEISLALIAGTLPGQPSVMVAAYNDNPFLNGYGLGFSRSTDGGASWASGQLPFPINPATGLSMAQAFDPTITADAAGNFYIGHISWDAQGYTAMFVHKSADGGKNWSTPVMADTAIDGPPQSTPDPNFRGNDRCQIVADTFSASSYTNRIYTARIKDRGFQMSTPDSDVYVSWSTDGTSFSTATRINDTGIDMANMPIPAVGADGTVYVAYMDYNVWTGGTGNVYLDRSTDGGATWGTDQLVATINLPPLNVFRADGTTDARAKGAAVLAAAPNDANRLYLVYSANPDGLGGDDANIYLIRSSDQGATWGSPVLVNWDDSSTCDQILPWIDVKPDGTVDLAWYDRRNDPNDIQWDIYLAKSTDGGLSFSPGYMINAQSFATPQMSWGEYWMGEYLGLATDGSYAYTMWASSVSDTLGDILFDKVANSLIPEPATGLLVALVGLFLHGRRRR